MIDWIKKYKKSVITTLIAIGAACTFLVTQINKYIPDESTTTTTIVEVKTKIIDEGGESSPK